MTDLLPPPVDGPQAWIGATLARQPERWTYGLSAAEVAEIAAATDAVERRGLDIAAITPAAFALPTLGPTLDGLRREVLDGRGFVLIRGLPVAGRSIRTNAIAYCGVGSYFGAMRSQNAMGHLLGHVRDLGVKADRDPTKRAYQSTERQLFHTDGSDIVGLLCLQKSKSGGLSSLVSSVSIYNAMATRRPDLARRLFAPLAFDRRGEVPAGQGPFFLMPVFALHEGLLSIGYTRRNINSAQRHSDAPRLTPEDVEALDLFDALANDAALRLDMAFEPGDMQFLHNHTILHDRTAYEDWPEPARKRHLLRLWLSPSDARPLPPAFLPRYGSAVAGDRGGILCPGVRLHAPLEPV